MSEEEKKEVQGEDVVEDDAPSVEKIEGMTPEERTEVIHGADPETVTDPEPDEGARCCKKRKLLPRHMALI